MKARLFDSAHSTHDEKQDRNLPISVVPTAKDVKDALDALDAQEKRIILPAGRMPKIITVQLPETDLFAKIPEVEYYNPDYTLEFKNIFGKKVTMQAGEYFETYRAFTSACNTKRILNGFDRIKDLDAHYECDEHHIARVMDKFEKMTNSEQRPVSATKATKKM